MMKQINCNANLEYCFKKPFQHLNDRIILNHEPELYQPITKEEDLNYYRDDWAILAFRAFNIVRENLKPEVKSFCTVGTGIGLDALGAIEAFSPEQVVLTDISEEIAMKAHMNVNSNLKNKESFEIIPIATNILDGRLKTVNFKFDLIYENLPNLPEEHVEYNCQPVTASFINYSQYSNIPEVYQKHLLCSHYIFLNQARQFLTPTGAVLCNIGGRVSYEIIEKMFLEFGFKPTVVVFDLKRQNEATTNLPVYAFWEGKMNSQKFKFYPLDKVAIKLNGKYKYNKLSGYADYFADINNELKDIEFSAQKASHCFKNGNKIAHSIYSIYAVRI